MFNVGGKYDWAGDVVTLLMVKGGECVIDTDFGLHVVDKQELDAIPDENEREMQRVVEECFAYSPVWFSVEERSKVERFLKHLISRSFIDDPNQKINVQNDLPM